MCFCVAGGDSAPRERNHHLQAVLQELELNIVVICDFQHHQALDTLEIVYLDSSSVLGGLILDGKIRDATFFYRFLLMRLNNKSNSFFRSKINLNMQLL